MAHRFRFVLLGLLSLLAVLGDARASLFNTPQFTDPEHFALGVEPEIVLSSGAGIGVQGKLTYGLSQLFNAQLLMGTGGGPRKFRLGGSLTFDLFPDIESQPGIGMRAQVQYIRLRTRGQLEIELAPYIHKAVQNGEKTSFIDPFLAFPLGWAFYEGRYDAFTSVNLGAIFSAGESLRTILELSVPIQHRETAISGGIVFAP